MTAGLGGGGAGDETAAFCLDLARWLRAEVDPLEIDRSGAIPRRHLDALAEMGAFGVTLPETHGGAGLPLEAGCLVTETLARHDRAIATTVGLHLGLGTRGLVAFGTDAQHARWLPDLASGMTLAAFAATEPRAGSDLSRFSTRTRVGKSGRIAVEGHKIYVTNGGLASVFTVATTVDDGSAGSGALVLLARDDAGVVVGKEEKKLGLRGSSTTTLHLDAVSVGADRIVGAETGRGHAQLAHVLAWGRTLMSAGCVGTAAAALDMARRHTEVRHQFGKALAEQPVVRAQLSAMAARLFAMRAIVRQVGHVAEDAAALERTSLAAKIHCSEMNWAICDGALQLHGGSGYIEETGIALPLRDARVTRIFEGANDVLLTRLGTLALVSPDRSPAPPGPMSADARAIEGAFDEALATIGAGRHLAALRDPAGLHRLGRLVVLREVARAVLTRHDPRYTNDSAELLRARGLADLAAEARLVASPVRDDGAEASIQSFLQSGAHP